MRGGRRIRWLIAAAAIGVVAGLGTTTPPTPTGPDAPAPAGHPGEIVTARFEVESLHVSTRDGTVQAVALTIHRFGPDAARTVDTSHNARVAVTLHTFGAGESVVACSGTTHLTCVVDEPGTVPSEELAWVAVAAADADRLG